ncbi:immune inhibitor A domain-containing protein [Asanoa iriomotensis]|uniref:immune inhibitor A domain-containing protein n=1 Tax=Asanoa iriomotensis TaxID=234613 RepID=UPI001943795D|nr:immune inhibitor A domain-containing protein [Asanoa iriomotensis]
MGLLGLSLAATTSFALSGAALGQTPMQAAANAPTQSEPQLVSDELSNPLESKRRELRDSAIQDVIAGKATPQMVNGSKVVKVGQKDLSKAAQKRTGKTKVDQYVELQREKTDKIFVILTEFGNQRHPSYPDKDMNPNVAGPTTFEGPLHNQIPEPNRAKDNSTIWQPDFNQEHFQKLYFGTGKNDESLKQYMETQSSGRYTVDGTVTNWVKVPYNEARYGRSNDPVRDGQPGDDPAVCQGNVCSNTWALIRDAANAWYADQLAQGRPAAEVNAELKSFDEWDRYDHDGDGNFNESDGYIDHFQIVHSGGDQADGDPHQGEDAIWSHRWAAFQGTGQGPVDFPIGGAQIGTSGVWIYDYTIQPENGGRSVFYHEYSHDLGLPDDYDTTGQGDNPNEYWTLMAQSRLGAKGEQFIGDRAGDLGAWNKLQLGWLDYVVTPAGVKDTWTLGPEEYNSDKPQALVVPLGLKDVVHQVGAPADGTYQWWSGDADDLTNAAAHTLTRQVTLPAGTSTLTFKARWDIEDCGADPCDFAYVEVDSGAGFVPIKGNITTATEAEGGAGIDGVQETWTDATFDLSAFASKTVGLRFRYETDPAQRGNPNVDLPNGLFVDKVAITNGSTTVFADGDAAGNMGWTVDGFQNIQSTFITQHPHYYIAGWRTYVSYDKYLQYGPYYFNRPTEDRVDHFPYQTGLLVSYWDTSQGDNNVSEHPGEGLNLYVDARPKTLYRLDGLPWRTRVQIYDAPFSLRKGDSFTLHHFDQAMYIRGVEANPVFDDTKNYFDSALPNHGVKLPAVGVKIKVLEENGTSVKIKVN